MVSANTIHADSKDRRLDTRCSESEELIAQIEMLPDSDEVSAVISQLGIDDLRAFATAITNAAADSARKGHADPGAVRLLNDWFASMEETVSAADSLEEILSRRRKRRASENR